MRIYRSSLEIPKNRDDQSLPRVVALGNFDGFHRGHRALLATLIAAGLGLKAETVLMTFEPHPREFLQKHSPAPKTWPRIWGPWDLQQFLRGQSLDILIEQSFDAEFAKTTAAEFLQKFILPMRAQVLVVGHDFAFGHNREGDLDTLVEFGKKNNLRIEVVKEVEFAGERVSTTQLKKLLAIPELEHAQSLMGAWPSLGGLVIHGQQRGRTIGVPTANLKIQIIPALAHGVYLVQAQRISDGKIWKGVANLGLNPTVSHTTTVKLETHLFDCAEDLYGQELRIEFRKYLRPEKKFASFEELKNQIQTDLAEARGTPL